MVTNVILVFLAVGATSVIAQKTNDPDGGYQTLPEKCSTTSKFASSQCRPSQDIGEKEAKLSAQCPNCPRINNLCARDRCPQIGPVTVLPRTASKAVIFMEDCLSWETAQAICCDKFGGRLWEPRTRAEYEEVMAEAHHHHHLFARQKFTVDTGFDTNMHV
jgi:hypothetical protein